MLNAPQHFGETFCFPYGDSPGGVFPPSPRKQRTYAASPRSLRVPLWPQWLSVLGFSDPRESAPIRGRVLPFPITRDVGDHVAMAAIPQGVPP